jgi:hypothetical protein
MRLIYHPDAEAALGQAAQFYEARVPQLGADFLDAVDRALSLVCESPERWRLIEADATPCRDFPTLSIIGHYQIICAFLPLHITGGIDSDRWRTSYPSRVRQLVSLES